MRVAILPASRFAPDPALLSAAEHQALARVAGGRRRDEWIRGRLAMHSVLGDPQTSVLVDPDGAPRPVGGAPCSLSLSHDGEWIAVAVAAAGTRVGIDLCLRVHATRIARILDWLAVRGDVEPVTGWVALEAVLKLRRWSIDALRDRSLALDVQAEAVVVRGLGHDAVVQLHRAPALVVGWTMEAG